MSVAKVIEISSQSNQSFEDAITKGVQRAGETIKDIRSAWVKEQEVMLKDGRIDAYRVKLKITFALTS